jgi:hypothetical protein
VDVLVMPVICTSTTLPLNRYVGLNENVNVLLAKATTGEGNVTGLGERALTVPTAGTPLVPGGTPMVNDE